MVYLLLADGFEEAEALVTADLLRRGGVEVALTGVTGITVTGGHNIVVNADRLLSDAGDDVEMVILPGGLGGVNHILTSPVAMEFTRKAAEKGAYVAAICAAPTILAELGLLEGRQAVVYPGMEDEMGPAQVCKGCPVVIDGKFITGEAAGAVFEFGLKLVEVLKGAETAAQVKNSVYYRH